MAGWLIFVLPDYGKRLADFVMAGLDPAIHHTKTTCLTGCPGPGSAKASPGLSALGRRSFSEDGEPGHDQMTAFGAHLVTLLASILIDVSSILVENAVCTSNGFSMPR
jgi:hypothetical protein